LTGRIPQLYACSVVCRIRQGLQAAVPGVSIYLPAVREPAQEDPSPGVPRCHIIVQGILRACLEGVGPAPERRGVSLDIGWVKRCRTSRNCCSRCGYPANRRRSLCSEQGTAGKNPFARNGPYHEHNQTTRAPARPLVNLPLRDREHTPDAEAVPDPHRDRDSGARAHRGGAAAACALTDPVPRVQLPRAWLDPRHGHLGALAGRNGPTVLSSSHEPTRRP